METVASSEDGSFRESVVESFVYCIANCESWKLFAALLSWKQGFGLQGLQCQSAQSSVSEIIKCLSPGSGHLDTYELSFLFLISKVAFLKLQQAFSTLLPILKVQFIA